MSKYIDDPIIQPEPAEQDMTIITLDVEVESTDGRFPDPYDVTNGRIACINMMITGLDGVMCYATHELTPYLKGKMDPEDTYIKCKDEADMLARALQFIGVCKPTHLRGDSGKDLDFITARAHAMNLKIDMPDLDKMFRQYDKPFSELYGIPYGKKSCPIAEAIKQRVTTFKEK
jgi:DNA polymerase elongation subunit (family B)